MPVMGRGKFERFFREAAKANGRDMLEAPELTIGGTFGDETGTVH
jgi:hypothetical protein